MRRAAEFAVVVALLVGGLVLGPAPAGTQVVTNSGVTKDLVRRSVAAALQGEPAPTASVATGASAAATPAPGATPGATPAATPAVNPVQLASDEAGLVDALRARGLAVEEAGPVEQPFLQVTGTVLLVSGGELAMPAELQVFTYPDATNAEADAAQIGPEGQPATMMISWIAPPHFFRQGPLLVLYLGDDPAILDLLTGLLGPQFAGQ